MSRSRLTVVALGDAAALVALRPDLRALRAGVVAPHRWLATTGADGVLADLVGALLWLVAIRVAIGLLTLVLAGAPGALGQVADAVAAAVLPAVVRRIVVGSVGLGVLLAPLAARAEGTSQPSPTPTSSVSAPATPAPGPSWPTGLPRTTPSPVPPPTPLPGPGWPRDQQHPTSHTAPPAPPKPAPLPAHHRAHRRASGADAQTRVRAGDCLWMIAAHRLGPSAAERDVADYVPRLYAANAGVVGADPDLISPGQVLDLPSADRSTPPPRAQESP